MEYFGIKFYICGELFGPWKDRQALPSKLVHGGFRVWSVLVWDYRLSSPARWARQLLSSRTFWILIFTFHRKIDLCEIKQPAAFMNLQQDCKHLETSSYWHADLFLLLQVSWTIIELELSHPAHQRPRLLKEDQIGQYTRFWHEDFRTNRSVKFF